MANGAEALIMPGMIVAPERPPRLIDMLESLERGQSTPPLRKSQCIYFEVDTGSHLKRIPHARRYFPQISGFTVEIKMLFLWDFEIAGMDSGCIRVYLQPIDMERERFRQLKGEVNSRLLFSAMGRFGISHVNITGKSYSFR